MRLTATLPRWLVQVADRQFWITANTPAAAKAGAVRAFLRDHPKRVRETVEISIEGVA